MRGVSGDGKKGVQTPCMRNGANLIDEKKGALRRCPTQEEKEMKISFAAVLDPGTGNRLSREGKTHRMGSGKK